MQQSMDAFTAKKLDRFTYLNHLYEIADGSSSAFISMYEIGDQIGFDRTRTANVVEYLVGEHLVERVSIGGGISITHHGVVEVERALSEPEKPTHYFPPVVNVVNVHSMVNSQIQQGTQNSSQSQQISQNDLTELGAFVDAFAAAVSAATIDAGEKAELEAEISTLKAQLASPKPKKALILESLKEFRNVLIGAAGKALASAWLPKITAFIAGIGG
jgi:hypothetical protein